MTVATRTLARDEVMTLFRTAWTASGAPSETLPILFWDIAQDIPDSGAWCRITMQHNEGEQVTLSNGSGNRRFRRFGVINVQIFTPIGDGLELNDLLTKIAEDAFEGVTSTNGIVFLNVRSNEVGPDGEWFQTNVLADFEYDEVK